MTKEKDKKHEVLIYRTMYRVNLRKMHETMQNRAGAISLTWVEKGVEARIFGEEYENFPENGVGFGWAEQNSILHFLRKGCMIDPVKKADGLSFCVRDFDEN